MRIAFATFVLVALLAASVATADRAEANLRLRQRVRAPVNPTSAQSMSSVPSSASVAAPVGSASMAAPNPTSMSASSASMAAPPVSGSASMAAPPAAASASMSVMSSSNSADAVSDSQTHENQVTVSAAPLSAPSSSSASSSSCSDSQSCKPTITCTTCGSGNGNQDSAVEDAVGPITQWLKDFKKRSGSDSDLFSAAKTVVQPLISKIKRNQDKAIEKLQQSNAAILQHIEEAATEHVYNLLRANRVTDENHESSLSASVSSESSYWSSESSHSGSSGSGSSGSLSALSSAAADKVYSELLKAASHSESSESRSELQKIAQDIVKNAKSL